MRRRRATLTGTPSLRDRVTSCSRLLQCLRFFPDERHVYLPLLETIIDNACREHPQDPIVDGLLQVRARCRSADYSHAQQELKLLLRAVSAAIESTESGGPNIRPSS